MRYGNELFLVIVAILIICVTMFLVTMRDVKDKSDISEMEQVAKRSADVKQSVDLHLDRLTTVVKRFKRATIKVNRDAIKSNVKRKHK